MCANDIFVDMIAQASRFVLCFSLGMLSHPRYVSASQLCDLHAMFVTIDVKGMFHEVLYTGASLEIRGHITTHTLVIETLLRLAFCHRSQV